MELDILNTLITNSVSTLFPDKKKHQSFLIVDDDSKMFFKQIQQQDNIQRDNHIKETKPKTEQQQYTHQFQQQQQQQQHQQHSQQKLTLKNKELWAMKKGQSIFMESMRKLGLDANIIRTKMYNQMSLEALKEEKAKVKNELKFYDSSFIEEFGIPPSRENKEIMKPLYLYYRSLKNAIDLKQQRNYEEEPKPSMMYNYNNHGRSNSAPQTQGGSQHQGSVNVRGMIGDITGVEKKKRSYSKNDIQLLEKEYFDIKKEQDGLKKILYKFQEDFQKSNNRKVKFLKDIVPVEKEYQTYKQNKNTLKQLKDIITDIQNKTCATTPASTQPKVVRE